MLAIGLALMSASPMAIEATGMGPQLRVIREQAAKRAWPITCMGHAGEEGVVRIGVPSGTSAEAVDSFTETVKSVASSIGNLGVNPSKQTCDREPVRTESPREARALIFTAGEDPELLRIAQECGFANASWRATTPEDVESSRGQIDAEKNPTTLDAGENATARFGPLTCFLKIGVTQLLSHDR